MMESMLGPSTNPYNDTLIPLWANAHEVFVDEVRLHNLARDWSRERFPIPDWRQIVFPDDDLVFVDFIGVGNTINFAFTNFETYDSYQVGYDGQVWRGAYAMWAALKRALGNNVPILDAKYLRALDQREFRLIFEGITELPLSDHRLAMLRDVGATLVNRFNGSFRTLFDAPTPSAFGAKGVVTQLVGNFNAFQDIGVVASLGLSAQFHKRAQLFAMMYEGRARTSTALRPLADSDSIGPIADYSVPRALHASGILKYSEELDRKVQSRTPIEPNSVEELEIRALAIRAQQLLLQEINRLRIEQPINYIQLDFKLWTLGRTITEPHHLTATTAY